MSLTSKFKRPSILLDLRFPNVKKRTTALAFHLSSPTIHPCLRSLLPSTSTFPSFMHPAAVKKPSQNHLWLPTNIKDMLLHPPSRLPWWPYPTLASNHVRAALHATTSIVQAKYIMQCLPPHSPAQSLVKCSQSNITWHAHLLMLSTSSPVLDATSSTLEKPNVCSRPACWNLPVGTRLLEHCGDTKHKRDKPVARHFNLPGHTVEDIRVIAIDRPGSSNYYHRTTLESKWINLHLTCTLLPGPWLVQWCCVHWLSHV